MAKKFRALRAAMPPAARERASAQADAMLLEMELQQLRKSRHLTQTELADAMRVAQGAISKIEHRDDMYVSTLREYIRALGGELELVAKFPDAEIKVRHFEPAK